MRTGLGGLLVAVLALATLAAPAAAQPEAVPVVRNGGFAVAIEVASDGTLVWGILTGEIMRLDPGETTARKIHTVKTMQGYEWGLTGLALAPDFLETGDFYVAFVDPENTTDPFQDNISGTMRIVRVHEGKETLVYAYEATRGHNGGRVLLHDGLLYVTNGDHKADEGRRSQDPGAEEGKLLRMTLDGKPAPGNPAETDPAWHPYAYSMGHRNPFGIAYDSVRDRVIVSDPGQIGKEEVNAIQKGGNYGHPVCRGPCNPPRPEFIEPLFTYMTPVTPVGIEAVGADYYVALFNNGQVQRLVETPGGWVNETYYEHDQGLFDLAASPDGKWLYVGAWNGLYRIPLPEGSPPRVTTPTTPTQATPTAPTQATPTVSTLPTPATPTADATPPPATPATPTHDDPAPPIDAGGAIGEGAPDGVPGPGVALVLAALLGLARVLRRPRA